MSQQQHPRSTAATSTQRSSNICRSKTVSDWATKVCKYLFNYAHVSARHSECLTEVGQRNVECSVGIQPNWRHLKTQFNSMGKRRAFTRQSKVNSENAMIIHTSKDAVAKYFSVF